MHRLIEALLKRRGLLGGAAADVGADDAEHADDENAGADHVDYDDADHHRSSRVKRYPFGRFCAF